MIKHSIKLAASTALLLGLLTPAFAEVKLNENFSVSGYTAGSYSGMKVDGGSTVDRLDVDSAQLLFKTDFAPVSAVASLFYVPSPAGMGDVTLLDAYATYTTSSGVSVTAGKFLSYLGYESFFNVNNPFISFANGDFVGPIPGYHSGVKADFTAGNVGFGAAIVDSIYSGNALKGDGELRSGGGFEAYASFKGIPKLTLWGGVAYDSDSPIGGGLADDIFTYNVWGQYQVNDKTLIAAEYAESTGDPLKDGYNWLVLASTALSDKFSIAGRVSGEDGDFVAADIVDGSASFMKYSIAPSFALTDKLTIRFEYSHYLYEDFDTAGGSIDNAKQYGVQAFFKF